MFSALKMDTSCGFLQLIDAEIAILVSFALTSQEVNKEYKPL